MRLSTPDLSIIIPVFNEAETLQNLFASLECQRGLDLEIIFSVSSSDDGSEALIQEYSLYSQHKIVVVPSVKGRAVQMNGGADVARGKLLLFLHADSYWHEPYLLRDAVVFFSQTALYMHPCQVVGHFCLNFQSGGRKKFFYRYLSEKAALNRRGTIYGDQGVLLNRALWHNLGYFREDVCALEDVFFANAVEEKARWVLLPQRVTTSARRYVYDGVFIRMLVNALLLIAGETGLLNNSPTRKCPEMSGPYSGEQYFFLLLKYCAQQLHCVPIRQYFSFWYICAQVIVGYSWYVCYACTWFIPFADSQLRKTMLSVHDRYVIPLLTKAPCCWIIGCCSWLVFYLFYLCVVYPGPAVDELKPHNSNLGELHDV